MKQNVTLKYSEYEVLKSLNKKKCLVVNNNTRNIRITSRENEPTDIGIRTKGKIDYLKNYCGYTVTNQ